MKKLSLIISLLLAFTIVELSAQSYKTIDRRTYNDANGTYYIVFTGYGKSLDESLHAYITFGKEDYRGRQSDSKSFGLYPSNWNSNNPLHYIKTIPGKILQEGPNHLKKNAINLIVKVDKQDMDKIWGVIKRYDGKGTYKLLSRDCTSMVIAGAKVLNLKTPSRRTRWSPHKVISYIKNNNR